MFIKHMVVEGVDGDVEILHVDAGAAVTVDGRVLCEMRPTDDADTRWAVAVVTATAICGTDGSGRPIANTAMIQEVLQALERVAGCNAAEVA